MWTILAIAACSNPDPRLVLPDAPAGITEPPPQVEAPGAVQLWTAAQLHAGDLVPWGEVTPHEVDTPFGLRVDLLGDLGGDGVPELWVQSEVEHVPIGSVVSAGPGRQQIVPRGFGECADPCRAVGDLDGDGASEILAGGALHASGDLDLHTDLGIPAFPTNASVVGLGGGEIAATRGDLTTVYRGLDLQVVYEHDIRLSFTADRDGDGLDDWVSVEAGEAMVFSGTRLDGPRLSPGDADEVLDLGTGGAIGPAGDVDGDGADDLVVTDATGLTLTGPDVRLTWDVSEPPRVIPADLDGDGLGDLVLSAAVPDGTQVALVLGADVPASGEARIDDVAALRLLWPGSEGAAWAVGDVDGDALDDWALAVPLGGAPDPARLH